MTSYDFIPVADLNRQLGKTHEGKAGAPVFMERVREVIEAPKHSSPLARVAKRILLGTSEEEKPKRITVEAPKRNPRKRG